jgi:hypothetical protein
VRTGLELELAPDDDARFQLDAGNLRLAAVAEEEIVAHPKSFDQIIDPIAIEVEAECHAVGAVAQGEIELDAGFGIEIRVPGDESSPCLAPVVAVGEQWVAKTTSHLSGELELRCQLETCSGEARKR